MRKIVKEIDKLLKDYFEMKMVTRYKGTGENTPNVQVIRAWIAEKNKEFKEEDKRDEVI